MTVPTLLQLFRQNSAGKATDKFRTGHAHTYAELFEFLDEKKYRSVLEIGIGRGGSIRTWRDFFVNAAVYGIDNANKHVRHVNEDGGSRVFGVHLDIDNKEALESFASDKTFDLIIDDGSKINKHQIIAFESLWNKVVPGGYYILEDTAKSYDERYIDLAYPLINDYFTSKLRDVTSRSDSNLDKSDIHYIMFREDMMVIKKKV